jgi:hypothetical protein
MLASSKYVFLNAVKVHEFLHFCSLLVDIFDSKKVTIAEYVPISNEELVSHILNFDFCKKCREKHIVYCIKRFVKFNGILEQSIWDRFPVPIVYKKTINLVRVYRICARYRRYK